MVPKTYFMCDPIKGRPSPQKLMFFWKSSEGGRGGVISDPKNYIADFVGFKAVYFGRKFWKKAQCNFQKGTRGGRGGQGRLDFKKKKTSIFETTVTPKYQTKVENVRRIT